MDIINFYTDRIIRYTNKFQQLNKKEKLLSFVRFFVFVGLIILTISLFSISTLSGILFLFPGIFIFGLVINFHLKTEKEKLKYKYLIEINNLEIECIRGNFSFFYDGSIYNDKEHPYSPDLDIFGKSSLFQMINRTNTKIGSDRLADWLKDIALHEEIVNRQQSIKELSEKIDWRQDLQIIYFLNKETSQDPSIIYKWCDNNSEFTKHQWLPKILYLSSILLITLIVLWFWGLSSLWVTLGITYSFIINYFYLKKINKVQDKLSKSTAMLHSLSEILGMIENEKFNSIKLNYLQQLLIYKESASKAIKALSVLSKKLDYRLNPLIGMPLNLLLFWDIHQCIKLDKWKKQHNEKIRFWFDAMSEVEALSSIANLYYNNQDWCFPEISHEYFILDTLKVGHPLIHRDKRIVNDFQIHSHGKIALITGSNMSGKSTFLRTCGINSVLAMAGAPVCAKKFNISHIHIYSSMRISDSLEENTSSFYAELKKLANIIRVVEKKEKVLLLLDEILRGTNSNDRHTGSLALIRQLIKNEAPAMIATHDLSLSSLEKEFPENIDIYNFDVNIKDEELYFDYKLNKGICKSLNASILMKKMGIEL